MRCPIRRTSTRCSNATAPRSTSPAERQWPPAIALPAADSRTTIRRWPTSGASSRHFRARADRFDLAIDAYKHYIELKPSDPSGYIGAAGAYLHTKKLDEAREHAQLAADVAPERDRALAGIGARAARENRACPTRTSTRLARKRSSRTKADPALPLPTFVEARILYDEGHYADALPLFEQTIADLKRTGAPQMTELHFYTADTLGRMERYPDAEKEFLDGAALLPAEHARARRSRDALSSHRAAGPAQRRPLPTCCG